MPKKKLTAAFVKTVKTEKQIDYYDTLKPGLGFRVSPGGAKTFFYRYRYKGKNQRYTINRYSDYFGLADARTEVDKLRAYVKNGGDPQGELQMKKAQKAPKTFKEVIEKYKQKHFQELKESTRKDYERRLDHFMKNFGRNKLNRPITSITRSEILNWLDDKADTAPTNAQRIQAILSGIFKFAQSREWTDTNIALGINFNGRIKRNRKPKWQNNALTDEQIRKLWEVFGQYKYTGRYFKLLLLTGQRAGETRLMKWTDIDLDKRMWTIPGSDTKNSLENHVPLSGMAMDILTELKPSNDRCLWVFESYVKGNPIGSAQKTANRIQKDTEISEFNLHSLRKTFATRQAGLGTPAQVLSKLLNHKKPGEGSAITALYDEYSYVEERRLATDKWNNYLQKILSGETTKVHRLGSAG